MSFRVRLFIGSLLTAVSALVAVDWWLTGRIRARGITEMEGHLEADAKIAAHALEASGVLVSALDDYARDMGRVSTRRLTFIADDGRVVGESTTRTEAETRALDNHAARPEVVAAREHGVGRIRRYSDTVRAEMLYVAVSSTHPVVRVVRVAMPTTQLDQELAALRRMGLVAFALGVPFAALVAWLMTEPLGRRVTHAARLARAYESGQVSAAPPVFESDELGVVSQSLDSVARELSRRVAELSQDRARIDAIVSGMVEGVVVVDGDGRVQRVNGAAKRFLGLSDSAVGRPLVEVAGASRLLELLSASQADGVDRSMEMPAWRDPSRTIVARAAAVAVDRGGGVVIVLHDISDIRRTDRMRQDFVANVSHELRTPLTVIRGYAEALADGGTDARDAQDFGALITRHATNMERLVADLLRLSRLDAQQETITLGPCRVQLLFDRVVQDLQTFIEAKSQHVLVEVGPGAEVITADTNKLHDVVRNLVDNAVTYAPEHAEIRLEAWATDGGVRLTVADNGPGIPADALPRIFERFYRVDPSRARPGGTGLGLAIVKHLVELHGGSVSAANSALGGAVFTVTLPPASA